MTLSVRLEGSGNKCAPEVFGATAYIMYGSPETLLAIAILHQSERSFQRLRYRLRRS